MAPPDGLDLAGYLGIYRVRGFLRVDGGRTRRKIVGFDGGWPRKSSIKDK